MDKIENILEINKYYLKFWKIGLIEFHNVFNKIVIFGAQTANC